MARFQLSRQRNILPRLPKLNLKNKFAKKLKYLWVMTPSGPIDIVGPARLATISGGSMGGNQKGAAFLNPSDSQRILIANANAANVAPDPGYTMMAVGVIDSLNDWAGFIIDRSGSGWGLFLDDSSHLRSMHNDNGWADGDGVTLTAGNWGVYGASHYLDGTGNNVDATRFAKQQGGAFQSETLTMGADTASDTFTDTELFSDEDNGAGRTNHGKWNYAAVWIDRAIKLEAEQREICQRPWQLFLPITQTIFYSVAAGGIDDIYKINMAKRGMTPLLQM